MGSRHHVCRAAAGGWSGIFLFKGLENARHRLRRARPWSTHVRPVIEELPASKIREVANAGLGRSDVLPFWFGESDEPTPPFIRAAAIASIEAGETFYSHNLGLPELRAALAGYVSAAHGPLGADRIAVTSSGVNALML